jgi:peptide/nickel transport system substrate-binding protein
MGTGHGFTEPDPFLSGMVAFTAKAVAVDKYTVQFQFKTPSALVTFDPMTPQVRFMPQEWVELYPDGSSDWTIAVATGPWFVEDFVAGSSVTYTRNPDYWGYDERHPQNKLPYVDTYKKVAIPDITTALASLRTGKIDMIVDFSGGPTWQQAETLAETNPDILQSTYPAEAACIEIRCDQAPFTDIRVRQALQQAIDVETIAQSHYGGLPESVPIGGIPPYYTGWTTSYDQWPADLQEAYSYDPENARKLLAEAGYPDGFETNIVSGSNSDLQLLQIIKAYYLDVGIEMEIEVMDQFTAMDYLRAGKHDQLSYGNIGHQNAPWQAIIVRQTGESRNYTWNNDTVFDQMCADAVAAIDLEETKRLLIEADLYLLRQFWSANLCAIQNPIAWQSYVKGFSGERSSDVYVSRVWIDQEMKTSLGR